MGGTLIRAVDNVTLTIVEGEFVALLGASGSGKSSLLNLIAGLDSPTSGTVLSCDKDLSRLSRRELAAYRRSIAKVAALDCDILLTPHPSASDLVKRFGAGKPLLDPDGCRKYAAGLSKQLDERLAKEAAAK